MVKAVLFDHALLAAGTAGMTHAHSSLANLAMA